VTVTTAEIVDLEMYRARRARAPALHATPALPPFPGLIGFGSLVVPMIPFAMPMTFFIFWSPWVLAPQLAESDGGDGGHSAA
jgi:hypothetical protein